ncbi:MAG: PA2169 family four-helix-bundle protein [Sphingomonadales bacterium]|nr:MAG: PA2169 family four-helix-bundle protein [Sphingomonadales bacterium]
MSDNTDISKLDDLIVTTIDSIKGYEHSAERADRDRYTEFFIAMASERRRVVEALSARSRELGGTPADYGSTAATVHRRIEDLRVALGGGDKAILSEIERGEDYLKEEFERALADDNISPGTNGVIRACFDSVVHGHDRTKALKESLAAVA